MSKFITFKSVAQKFHSDERGIEALQVVILAVASIALIAVKTAWGSDDEGIKGWFVQLLGDLLDWES